MNRSTFRSLVFAAASAVVAMTPLTLAHAQALSTPLLTSGEVRTAYVEQGFQTSRPITWWTNGSTTFTVEDPAEQNSPSARVLMVIVYPDRASADAEHRDGVHLVPGYGPSVWQGNVAMVQTTRSELARRYAAEVNRDDPSYVQTGTAIELLAEASYPVALDFVAVLQNQTASNL
jgi:hypothetical protein